MPDNGSPDAPGQLREISDNILEHLSEGIWSFNGAGRTSFVNKRMADMLLYNVDEMMGTDLLCYVYENKSKDLEDLLARLRGGAEVRRDFEFMRSDGDRLSAQISACPIMNSSGAYSGAVMSVTDMTATRKTLDHLRKLSRAVEQSSSSVVITDKDGNIEYVNPKFTRLTGYSAEEAIGQNPRVLKSGEQSHEFYRAMWQTISSGKEWRGEFHNKKKNGETYWEFASISAIRDAGGNITHYIAVKEDVTELKKTQAALLDAKESAEAATRAMSEFLATISHELRVPLTSIHGSLELLASGQLAELPPKARDLVAVAERNSLRLAALISDILDLESLQSGRMTMSIGPVLTKTAITRAIEVVSGMARQCGITILTSGKDMTVIADEDRLAQALVNLLSNAIKFSPDGSQVEIRTTAKPESVEISVLDHGEGIPIDSQEVIFEKFRRLQTPGSRKIPGSGLGLAICKSIIEQLDGSIGVESEPGKGSRFWLRLRTSADAKADEKRDATVE